MSEQEASTKKTSEEKIKEMHREAEIDNKISCLIEEELERINASHI